MTEFKFASEDFAFHIGNAVKVLFPYKGTSSNRYIVEDLTTGIQFSARESDLEAAVAIGPETVVEEKPVAAPVAKVAFITADGAPATPWMTYEDALMSLDIYDRHLANDNVTPNLVIVAGIFGEFDAETGLVLDMELVNEASMFETGISLDISVADFIRSAIEFVVETAPILTADWFDKATQNPGFTGGIKVESLTADTLPVGVLSDPLSIKANVLDSDGDEVPAEIQEAGKEIIAYLEGLGYSVEGATFHKM